MKKQYAAEKPQKHRSDSVNAKSNFYFETSNSKCFFFPHKFAMIWEYFKPFLIKI